MKKKDNIKWLTQPYQEDYPAAQSYLSLTFEESEATSLVEKLKLVTLVEYKAKDIFSASSLSLLGISNRLVKKDLKKIKNDDKISPLLLVRNSANGKVIIADGYHRLCAVYSLDEDALIPCKIV